MKRDKPHTKKRLPPIRGKCPSCGIYRNLTKHSETGDHRPPFVWRCKKCHDKIHGFGPGQPKTNKKVQRETRYGKLKKR